MRSCRKYVTAVGAVLVSAATPFASAAVSIHGHDRGISRSDAAHFEADHFQVERVLIVVEAPFFRALTSHGQFTQENLAEMREIDHVAEGGSGSAVHSVYK
jgi:hypothetical protein